MGVRKIPELKLVGESLMKNRILITKYSTNVNSSRKKYIVDKLGRQL